MESPVRAVKDATEVEDDVRWYYMHVEDPHMAYIQKGREFYIIMGFKSKYLARLEHYDRGLEKL